MSTPGGATVVLLHGVGLDHTMWDRVAPELPGTVLAPDLLGHGSDPGAPDAPPGTTLADLAAPVAALVAGTTAPVHLVGFSLGALVATAVALDAGERVASVTLVSGVVNRTDAERAAVAARLDAARADLPATFDAAVDRWFSPAWRAAEPDLVDRVRGTLAANRPASYLAAYAVFAGADAALWLRLPRLAVPTLAITGADDPGSTPAMARALAAHVPHGRAVVVPGARHLLPLERPDAVVDAIADQLRRTPQPSLGGSS